MVDVLVRGLDEVNALLRDMPDTLFGAAKTAMGGAVINTQRRILDNFSSGAGHGGSQLRSRTGSLKRSLKTKVSGTGFDSLRGSVHTDSIYATMHEKGGTIRAKDKYMRVPGGPYLNIPTSSNKTAAGVMRYSARDVFNAGGYMFKSRRNNWIVANQAGVPMFVLKNSVTMPARLGMIRSAEDEMPTLLSNLSNLMIGGLDA